jgi:hypothetical protein
MVPMLFSSLHLWTLIYPFTYGHMTEDTEFRDARQGFEKKNPTKLLHVIRGWRKRPPHSRRGRPGISDF